MSKENYLSAKVIDKIKNIFFDEIKGYKSKKQAILDAESLRHLEITSRELPISKLGFGIEISICQMYSFVDHSFSKLKALSELFGTDQIDVDNWSQGGCETCDYGSQYKVTFQIYNPTKLLKRGSSQPSED